MMTTTAHPLRGASAIVGQADMVSPTGVLDLWGRPLHSAVARLALDDAGLTFADVDGLAATGTLMASSELGEHLGINPRWTDTTMTGGSSFEVLVQHAAAAITTGLAEVILVVYGETPRGDRQRGAWAEVPYWLQRDSPITEWESPYALRQPLGPYALAASRHMALYGTTGEQLAQIAVSTREWAARNPDAKLRDPITVEDVLASPYEVEPLHRMDCCLVTDGAGAIVMTSAERAADLRHRPAYVLGAATRHSHALMIGEMPDLTTTAGRESAKEAFAMAGVRPDDVDAAMLYDSFTITALLHLEDLGFCEKGEGGPFVEDGKLGPGGSLPVNTNGGGLAYTHPGMYGMFLLTEAARQVSGTAGDRQLPRADLVVAHGCGAVLSAFGTVVLGSAAT
jgi:acetyl-CoA acetyltransferase